MTKKINNLIDVKKIVKYEKENLVKNFGVKKIGIFGSFVFDDFTPKSDVDILIELSKQTSLSLSELVNIENSLSHKLGRKVDLVTKNSLKPYIRNNILKSVVYV